MCLTDLIEYNDSDTRENEEWGGIEEGTVGGQKRKREETRGSKRKKLNSLPTFAFYETFYCNAIEYPDVNCRVHASNLFLHRHMSCWNMIRRHTSAKPG